MTDQREQQIPLVSAGESGAAAPSTGRQWPFVLLMAAATLALLAPVAITLISSRETIDTFPISRVRLDKISNALDRYRAHLGRYPQESDGGLSALFHPPADSQTANGWLGPYVQAADLRDAWGREFAYRCPGIHNREHFDLASAGPDGIYATADDIKNWCDP